MILIKFFNQGRKFFEELISTNQLSLKMVWLHLVPGTPYKGSTKVPNTGSSGNNYLLQHLIKIHT